LLIFGILYGYLAHFPFLVCCTKKNLATLISSKVSQPKSINFGEQASSTIPKNGTNKVLGAILHLSLSLSLSLSRSLGVIEIQLLQTSGSRLKNWSLALVGKISESCNSFGTGRRHQRPGLEKSVPEFAKPELSPTQSSPLFQDLKRCLNNCTTQLMWG
jgi:hypothetical protein